MWDDYLRCPPILHVLIINLYFNLQPAKKKQRAQVIEFFIDVARECFNIGNFNSLMAIICKYSS